ncbi:hypothetical protein VTK56DRAFT_9761 [Thermocarpiscus australiensis]
MHVCLSVYTCRTKQVSGDARVQHLAGGGCSFFLCLLEAEPAAQSSPPYVMRCSLGNDSRACQLNDQHPSGTYPEPGTQLRVRISCPGLLDAAHNDAAQSLSCPRIPAVTEFTILVRDALTVDARSFRNTRRTWNKSPARSRGWNFVMSDWRGSWPIHVLANTAISCMNKVLT